MTEHLVTAEEIRVIEQRLGRASVGPWFHNSTSVMADLEPGRSLYKIAHAYEAGTAEQFRAGHGNCVDNAEFIAHAREDVPRLIATVKALREMLIWHSWRTREGATWSNETVDAELASIASPDINR